MKRLLTIVLILESFSLFSQSPTQLLKHYFDEVRAGRYPEIPKEVFRSENAGIILSSLSTYYNDTLSSVRGKANSITRTVGLGAKKFLTKQECVLQLIVSARDKDSGNVGSVFNYLMEFNKNDFNSTAKDSLRSLYLNKPPHFEKLIRLIGFVELTDLQEELQILSEQKNTPKNVRWAAQLAVARMGDKGMLQSILDRAKKLPVNDDFVYEIVPDLIYTRQIEAINYLTRILFSSEMNCQAADVEQNKKIPCAYRIMEQLASVIDNYPYRLDESGDIQSKDYEAALLKVREWFRHQKNYKILTDTY